MHPNLPPIDARATFVAPSHGGIFIRMPFQVASLKTHRTSSLCSNPRCLDDFFFLSVLPKQHGLLRRPLALQLFDLTSVKPLKNKYFTDAAVEQVSPNEHHNLHCRI